MFLGRGEVKCIKYLMSYYILNYLIRLKEIVDILFV